MSAVTAVHLIDEGAYIVTLPYGDSFEVDGIPVTGTREVVVQNLAGVARVVKTAGEPLHWASVDGETILAADYQAERMALLEGASDDGDLSFPTLDAEFAYRKFIARWTQQVRAEPRIKREPVEFEVVEVRVRSGDPDIVSLWNSPNVENDRRLYRVNRDGVMIARFRELCAEHDLGYVIPTYSALRYAQVEGAYAFDDSFNESRQPFIGTLEQCKAQKQSLRERVERQVRPHAMKKSGAQMQNAGEVALALRGIAATLMSVRAKQDTAASLVSARRQITELFNALTVSATGEPK